MHQLRKSAFGEIENIELEALVGEEVVEDIPSIIPETLEITDPVIDQITPIEEIVAEVDSIEEIIEEAVAELPIIEPEPLTETMEEPIEEQVVTTTILSSSVNNYVEPQAVVEQEYISKSNTPKADELEIIEGIGPKIAMLLYDSGIFTFRDLATTPVYKIQEILEQAGPQFARHDPSTWTQQAKLAAEGRWNDLEALKFYLVGGREPKKDEVEEVAETIPEIQAPAPVEAVSEEIIIAPEPIVVEEPVAVAPIVEEVKENISSFTVAPVAPVENNLDSITEEMLEKVNKVKAAIRKAMVEKNDVPVKDNTPLPTLNDIISKNESTSNSSFFDNL